MVAAITIRSPRKAQGDKKSSNYRNSSAAIHHAVRLIHAVCGLSGSATLIDDDAAVGIGEVALGALGGPPSRAPLLAPQSGISSPRFSAPCSRSSAASVASAWGSQAETSAE